MQILPGHAEIRSPEGNAFFAPFNRVGLKVLHVSELCGTPSFGAAIAFFHGSCFRVRSNIGTDL
jgi:hypothetical protein